MKLSDARVLMVGMGGLGCPAAQILVRSGIGSITLLEDDVVDITNLHRQTLYTERDVGRKKIDCAAAALYDEAKRCGNHLRIEIIETRLLPHNALRMMEKCDLVVEGADNFATKFLAADAARIANKTIAQAGAVRWSGWAMLSTPDTACLRCLFEDIPHDQTDTCATAGVVGPVVGAVAALQTALALRWLNDAAIDPNFHQYDGLQNSLRSRSIARRADCPLCTGKITEISADRYLAPCAD